jgi:hypothetical protein
METSERNVRQKSVNLVDQIAPCPSAGWQAELDERPERKRIAQPTGGPERIRHPHAGGRLAVCERIDRCLDADSFLELGSIAGDTIYDDSRQPSAPFQNGPDDEDISNGRLGQISSEIVYLTAANMIGTIPKPHRMQNDQ